VLSRRQISASKRRKKRLPQGTKSGFTAMTANSTPDWGTSFRLTAAEKWKAKSAIMGRHVTEALVGYAQPQPGMRILDLACGTGEPAITIATRIAPTGHVTALDLSADLLAVATGRARARGLTIGLTNVFIPARNVWSLLESGRKVVNNFCARVSAFPSVLLRALCG
jgi:2-polyprenyl-3-methyl-5-hydroxy-6-metoxy-1,4-benzoquinol methylase